MNNLVLNRINYQIQKSLVLKPTIKNDVIKASSPQPIAIPELRKLLMENITENNLDISPQIEDNQIIDLDFDGIESFVGWYETKKDKFSESQNVALSTLIQMRDMINNGCGCKRMGRLNAALDYYRTFWTQNSTTDLPQKIKEVGQANSVTFRTSGNIILKI